MASSALSSAMPQRDIKVLQVLLKSWSLTPTPLRRHQIGPAAEPASGAG
jgi:hypothetical protein